jgi:hypothetical protein
MLGIKRCIQEVRSFPCLRSLEKVPRERVLPCSEDSMHEASPALDSVIDVSPKRFTLFQNIPLPDSNTLFTNMDRKF